VDTILKSFPFQLIFRGVFPGGFFVLSYVVASEGFHTIESKGDDLLTLWLPLAVFVGVIVYVLHRSLFYPLAECFFDSTTARGTRACCPLIRASTVQRSLDMWSTGERNSPKENIARHLTAWNDYVHLQYASGWCIMAGTFCAWNTGRSFNARAAKTDDELIVLTAALFLSGFVCEWRLRVVAGEALRRHPPRGDEA